MQKRRVRLYALSTCGWCRKTKAFLEGHQVEYECFDIDLLEGEAKEAARDAVGKLNPRRSYPTIIVDDDEVVVGFDEDKLKQLLGL
ncbi:MAG TPA: glutaredoxin family protein [Myxococcota bacterium]|nr:glutaredoxin family protein [Myxococcota bacterium]HRY95671.1 glutaredoxin family protein [Myxococcota bacterium]HSA21275.1 glutaredoxin family protein [Myxococcota bacterium]